MNILVLGRYALSVGACMAFAACSSGASQLAPTESIQQQRSVFHSPVAGRNGRISNNSGDLLYVGQGSHVDMYAFPRITKDPVGTIQIGASGLCSDKNGNVWVSSPPPVGKRTFQMIEYPHGGTNPIAQLSAETPLGCAVDPKSGDLAVANTGIAPSENGYVAVYHKAEGNPEIFSDPNISHFYYCAYDKAGNLLAQGRSAASSETAYAELTRGARKLQDVGGTIGGGVTGVQYDGIYFVVGGFEYNTLYGYAIANGQATLKEQITLDPGGTFSLAGFSIDGNKLAGLSQSSNFYRVATFPYPQGGSSMYHHLIGAPSGLTVSVAPH